MNNQLVKVVCYSPYRYGKTVAYCDASDFKALVEYDMAHPPPGVQPVYETDPAIIWNEMKGQVEDEEFGKTTFSIPAMSDNGSLLLLAYTEPTIYVFRKLNDIDEPIFLRPIRYTAYPITIWQPISLEALKEELGDE